MQKNIIVLYYWLCVKLTSVLSGQNLWSHQCPLKTESIVGISEYRTKLFVFLGRLSN